MISTKKKAPNFDVNIMMKIFIHKFYSNENTFLEKNTMVLICYLRFVLSTLEIRNNTN